MKIYLTINNQPLNGYVTVDPTCSQPSADCIISDIKQIDHICSDSECEEILAPEVVDYIGAKELVSTITHWKSKLRHGGKLILGGTDIMEVARQVMMGRISVPDANTVLYGTQETLWSIKSGCYSMNDVVGLVKEMGLRITNKRVDGTNFIVEAIRD